MADIAARSGVSSTSAGVRIGDDEDAVIPISLFVEYVAYKLEQWVADKKRLEEQLSEAERRRRRFISLHKRHLRLMDETSAGGAVEDELEERIAKAESDVESILAEAKALGVYYLQN